jgi:hypothetical protein
MATTSSLMTAEELLALPDDGIDRELIRGELREYPMRKPPRRSVNTSTPASPWSGRSTRFTKG